MRILLFAVFQRAISLPPTIPTNIHSWPRRRLDVTMRINNHAMALSPSSAPTMPTAVRPTPISGENSASSTAAPPTSGVQPINIAHVPTPSPPGAPDRRCAAGVHCMADHTAGDPSQSIHSCVQCGKSIHSELTCGDNIAALQMSGHGFAFGYLRLLSTPLQNKLRTGTPDPTNLIVCYACQKLLQPAMTECIKRGGAVDLNISHTSNLRTSDTSQVEDNNDENSVLKSQGQVNRD